MSVWFAVVASITFMYMTSSQYEWSTPMRVILAIMYAATFIGGMIYESNQKDKVKQLEKEIEKLKDNSAK